jgi:hypothetical protein
MITAFAVYVFLLPHGPHFAPEIGPLGNFIVFGLVLSGFYIINFLVFAVPSYYLLRTRAQPTRRWLRVLCGTALFLCSVPLWLVGCGGHNSGEGIVLCAVLAIFAGGASFYVLSPRNPG